MVRTSIETRAKRRAARINARRAMETPLLAAAGLIEMTTPEAEVDALRGVEKANRRCEEARQRLDEELEHWAQRLRDCMADNVSQPVLAHLDACRAQLPETPEYSADFYSRIATRLGLICRRRRV